MTDEGASGRTYVSNKDDLAPLPVGGCEVGESVGGHGCGLGPTISGTTTARSSSARASTVATAVASTETATTASETTATSESTTTTEAPSEAPTASKAPAAAETTSHGVGKPVNADLEYATVPIVAVELLNRVSRIVRGLEDNNTGALGPSIRSKVNVGTNDATGAS